MDASRMERTVVVGGGLMGSGFAQIMAQPGPRVSDIVARCARPERKTPVGGAVQPTSRQVSLVSCHKLPGLQAAFCGAVA